MANGSVVVVGGTQGLGRELAQSYAGEGRDVIVTGRDQSRAERAANEIGGNTRGASASISQIRTRSRAPSKASARWTTSFSLRSSGTPTRWPSTTSKAALRLVTMKLVGYTEVIHVLLPRLRDDSSILIYGGLARDRPYPGSTTVTTVNGGVTSLVRTLVIELAPIRVNAIHNGIVGDSPQWRDMAPERHKALVDRTPIGRLVTMAESMNAARFLLENAGVNGINLALDGGWMCT